MIAEGELGVMELELNLREDTTIATVRRRGLLYLNYVFWALTLAALLVAADMCASLFARWIAFLEAARRTLGLAPPVSGPDYWILGGAGAAGFVTIVALIAAWNAYRRSWNRKLTGFDREHVRIRRLRPAAGDAEIAARTRYLEAVTKQTIGDYRVNAAALLREMEAGIAQRAVTAGLMVGLSRNRFIDTVTILGAALEVQFHVLTRLGKQPSLRTWIEMLKRTGSSLFLNWYVSRGDALYIKLAMKKTAWGLSVASDASSQAADSLNDLDWDEIVHGMGGTVPEPALHVMSALGTVAAKGMTIGAFGLKQLAHFVEITADDLLQGVLAGGILYYHGMSLAADCLALDEQHRASPEMNRTIGQAMAVACAPAGKVLLEQVRAMRRFLRARRKMMLDSARKTAGHAAASAVGGVRGASNRMMDRVKSAFGRSTTESSELPRPDDSISRI